MIGVATLIIVMSVMNGFREELVNRILGINGHLVVYGSNGKLIENYNDISHKLLQSIEKQNWKNITYYIYIPLHKLFKRSAVCFRK